MAESIIKTDPNRSTRVARAVVFNAHMIRVIDMTELTDNEIDKIIKRAGLNDPKIIYSGRSGQSIATEAIAQLLALNYRSMVKQDKLNKIGIFLATVLAIGEVILTYLAYSLALKLASM